MSFSAPLLPNRNSFKINSSLKWRSICNTYFYVFISRYCFSSTIRYVQLPRQNCGFEEKGGWGRRIWSSRSWSERLGSLRGRSLRSQSKEKAEAPAPLLLGSVCLLLTSASLFQVWSPGYPGTSRSESDFCHLIDMWLWDSYLTFLNLFLSL